MTNPMRFRTTNIDASVPLDPRSIEHRRRSFMGAMRVYGVDSREAEIAYGRWAKAQKNLGPWNPDDWREQSEQLRLRGTA